MEVVINGELKVVKSSLVSELLEELGISKKKLAIEINKNILPRDSYSSTVLTSGDCLEIVHFIGGG
jgi:thiamine biosynthesis protein ThiS